MMAVVAVALALAISTHVARPPPAWRALQNVPDALFVSRGKLQGTPPCLATLEKANGYGKAASWRLGRLAHGKLHIEVGLSLDRNPVEPCAALVFVDEDAGAFVGRILLACGESDSSLRGMEIRKDLRGHGLAKLLLAAWLHLCIVAGLTSSTRTINKPRLSLSLQRFGFAPVNDRGEVVTVGTGDHARIAYVRTDFELGADAHNLEVTVEEVLGDGGMSLAASPLALRQALTLRPLLTLRGGSAVLAPTWEALHARAVATPTGARLASEAAQRVEGGGPPHVNAKLRLFDAEGGEDSVRVTLYRDAAAWCPYCQKVWLTLEEKRIPYRVTTVPLDAYGYKPTWYSRLVDGGKLPAIELDGELLIESNRIMERLDATFSDHAPRMRAPAGSAGDARAKELLALLDLLVVDWFSLVFYPVEGPQLEGARHGLIDGLRRVDAALGTTPGPWFLGGDSPSFVDVAYIVSFERLLASTLYFKGLRVRELSLAHVDAWLAAYDARPAYRASKSDYYTHAFALPSQNGPGYEVPEASEVAARLGGLDGGWTLDALLTSAGSLSTDEPLSPEQLEGGAQGARHEAAYQLVANAGAVVHFAARGGSEPGRPAFAAELADPNAEANEELVGPVDVALRHVAAALLDGVDDATDDAKADLAGSVDTDAELMPMWYEDVDNYGRTYYWNDETGETTYAPPTGQLDACLAYLRDRVGVPRDMGASAALMLRATLDWAIGVVR